MDYNLILKASLDDSAIAAQIQKIANNNSLTLKVNVDAGSSGLQNVQSQVKQLQEKVAEGSKTPVIDPVTNEQATEQIKAQILSLVAAQEDFKSMNNISLIPNENGDITSATIKYNSLTNEAITETATLNSETQQWGLSVTKITDNIQQEAAAFARMSQQADTFLMKTKAMDSNNPTVSKGNVIAGQLQGAISEGDIDKAKQLSQELSGVNSVLGAMGKSTQSFSQEMGIAISRTISWTLAMTAVFGTFQMIQSGIQYVIDLNKQMTQIQMVTGGTDTQTKALTADYHQMAQELGATTLEVAKASETWIRQGKSASDAAMLTKDSIMMAKLAVTDTATAADNLTGIMNGFQMQAKDATSVMDKMLAVSNSTKTSAAASFNEISTAMKSSAVVAQQTGVSYDQLLSYIAVASTATRQSSETTGQALPERSGALNYKYNKIQRKFPLMIPIFIP